MTLLETSAGVYALTLTAAEQARLARAQRRYGAGWFKARIEADLELAGGAEAESTEIKQAFAKADSRTQADVKAALGIE